MLFSLAQIDADTLAEIQSLERDTGKTIVAFQGIDATPATLEAEERSKGSRRWNKSSVFPWWLLSADSVSQRYQPRSKSRLDDQVQLLHRAGAAPFHEVDSGAAHDPLELIRVVLDLERGYCGWPR